MSRKESSVELQEHLKFLQDGIFQWWCHRSFDFPWRDSKPEWQSIVVEVLLQRTHAEAVKKIYGEFFARFPSPESLAAADESEVRDAIFSLGLLWRAKFLPTLGAALVEKVPDSYEELVKLPGVGPYVAGAYLTLHQNIRTPFVDANVVRLLGRFIGFQWDGETRRKKWFLEYVEAFFATQYPANQFGYAVLDFSRDVCKTRPDCEACDARQKCAFFNSIQPMGLPA